MTGPTLNEQVALAIGGWQANGDSRVNDGDWLFGDRPTEYILRQAGIRSSCNGLPFFDSDWNAAIWAWRLKFPNDDLLIPADVKTPKAACEWLVQRTAQNAVYGITWFDETLPADTPCPPLSAVTACKFAFFNGIVGFDPGAPEGDRTVTENDKLSPESWRDRPPLF